MVRETQSWSAQTRHLVGDKEKDLKNNTVKIEVEADGKVRLGWK